MRTLATLLLFCAMSAYADALFVTQSDAVAPPASCTDGVDCFCERTLGTGPLGVGDPLYDADVIRCEDFASATWGALSGYCQAEAGTWPDCTGGTRDGPVAFSVDSTAGYYDPSNGIADTGTGRMLLSECQQDAEQWCETGASVFFADTINILGGSAHYGLMWYTGSNFWATLCSDPAVACKHKLGPELDDSGVNRPVLFVWDASAIQSECAYAIPGAATADGTGFAEVPTDDLWFNYPYPPCPHTLRLNDAEHSGQWWYVELGFSGAGITVSFWDRAGVFSGVLAECALPDCLGDGSAIVDGFFPYYFQSAITAASITSESYMVFDNIRISTSPMGPPPGFVQ